MMNYKKIVQNILLGILLLLGAAALYIVAKTLLHTVEYEMAYAYNPDAPLYWAVGHGIRNGIKPYSGLYENKPPVMFLISALSFAVGGDIRLCDAFTVGALFIIALVPLASTVEYAVAQYREKRHLSPVSALAAILLALTGAPLLMLYTEQQSGRFQTEAIGAAFIILYYWAAFHISPRTPADLRRPGQIVWMLLAALFVMCGVMTKEPFVLLAFFGGLLIVDSLIQFIGKIVLPLAVGGCTALLLLVITGVAKPYFTIYIRNMFAGHIAVTGSPVTRGLHIEKLAMDIRGFSLILLVLVIFTAAVVLLPQKEEGAAKPAWSIWAYRVAAFLAAVYAASFSVGLGGQYYDHHYIFAAPLYVLLLVLCCRRIAVSEKIIPAVLVGAASAVLAVCVFARSNLTFLGDYDDPNVLFEDQYAEITAEADYVDAMLDYYGENRYQFIGFNGEAQFYGLTEHSPQGPVFAQDTDNFTSADTWFAQQMLAQMEQSNIVIVDHITTPEIADELERILEDDFTTEPADAYEGEKPEIFPFDIYYRTSIYG